MDILALLLFGLIAGAVARFLIPGPGLGGGIIGIAATIGIGIAGAFIGSYLGRALDLGTVTGFNVESFVIATCGAILLLLVWRAIAVSSRGVA